MVKPDYLFYLPMEIDTPCEQCLQNSSHAPKNATHVCFDCEKYLCFYCSGHHRSHTCTLLRADQLTDHNAVYNAVEASIQKEGDIKKKFMEVEMKVYSKVKVHHFDDKDISTCYITGIAVVSKGDRAVLIDNHNYCLKILDLKRKEIIRYVRFEKSPWGITNVPLKAEDIDDEAEILAVTFPTLKEIAIMDITKTPLKIISTYITFDECYDLAFSRDNFVTLCYRYDNRTPLKHYVCLLNVDGLTMKVIYISPAMSGPTVSISAHPNQDIIFISSYDDQLVRFINYEGRVLKEFNFSLFGKPINICLGADQTVLISSHSKDKQFSLHRFSLDMSDKKSVVVGDLPSGHALTSFKDKAYTCQAECSWKEKVKNCPRFKLSIIKID